MATTMTTMTTTTTTDYGDGDYPDGGYGHAMDEAEAFAWEFANEVEAWSANV
jgi:hypothetical protein